MIDVKGFRPDVITVSSAAKTFVRTALLRKHIGRIFMKKQTLKNQIVNIYINDHGLVHHRTAFVHAVRGFLVCGAAYSWTFLVAVLGI